MKIRLYNLYIKTDGDKACAFITCNRSRNVLRSPMFPTVTQCVAELLKAFRTKSKKHIVGQIKYTKEAYQQFT